MKRYVFLDRDGTLIEEPEDFQIDSYEKFRWKKSVIPSLLRLKDAGFRFVMVSNQDGLGTDRYPLESFEKIQSFLLSTLESQGIVFDEILICPHFASDQCLCRKPQIHLMKDYCVSPQWDRSRSYMIGDRETDRELGTRMGLRSFLLNESLSWEQVTSEILSSDRQAKVSRTTKETDISIELNLDQSAPCEIETGLPFFNHMLDQVCSHAGVYAKIRVNGDLHIDEHHSVEDCALVLGEAFRQAMGDRWGIGRYGFVLPMDEACTQVSMDLSGRFFFKFDGSFSRESINGFSTEMVPHFFSSFAQALGVSLHIMMTGQNTHHQVESVFKSVGRCLRAAIVRQEATQGIPSTKGVLQ